MAESLVAHIQKLLDDRDWRPADLARRSGLNPGTVSNILNGKRQAGVDTLVAIAKAFNVPPEELLQLADLLPKGAPGDLLERRFMTLVDALPDEQRQELMRFAEYLVDRYGKKK